MTELVQESQFLMTKNLVNEILNLHMPGEHRKLVLAGHRFGELFVININSGVIKDRGVLRYRVFFPIELNQESRNFFFSSW